MKENNIDILLKLENASIYQGDKLVISGINLELKKGSFYYLIGKTGSGKSSFLKILYADLPLNYGVGEVCGYDLRKLKSKQVPFLRRKLGIVFQDFELLQDRTVSENLVFVMKATGWNEKSKIRSRVTELLMRVGMSSCADKFPYQLSGGEQQRIAVARALINEPLLLLADEPTGNLDPEVSDEIMKLFVEINNSGTTVLMATHNYNLINKFPGMVLKCENAALNLLE
ncbi:MAG: ATP-binding cassette domain-containing protein [Cytophagales bacterium]